MSLANVETLVQCGLTKNEAKVYLALLKVGTGTAIELTKQSYVHRVNVYDALERLRGKGLISTIFQGKKRIYEAANPQQLLQLIKGKEEQLNQILPQLQQEFKLPKEKQQVHHFFGPDGVMRAYWMMLDQNATIYGIGGQGLNRKYLRHRHEMFNKKRIAQNMHLKALYYEYTRQDRQRGWEHDTLTQIRYMPDKYKGVGMVDICGDLVLNLIPVEDNIMVIVIENRSLADTYRMFFDFMWVNAKN